MSAPTSGTAPRQRRRALITGIGILCPLGRGTEVLLEGIRRAESGISEITSFDPSPFRTKFGGEIKGFDPTSRLTDEEIADYTDLNLQFALTAARDAVEDAGLVRTGEVDRRFGLVVGTCNGGLRMAERQYRLLLGQEEGVFDREMSMLIRYHTLGKALACGLAVDGPVWVTATACSSSTGALGLATELIELGVVDRLLVGGSDALCLSTMAGFDAIRATSTGRTAPFSVPPGLNLGEGAAFWMVESEAAALQRGAPVRGELLGYALTADAYHPTAPDPRGEGAFRTMSGALARAGVSLDELTCINAHGTGTEANDRVESKAVARFIGDRPISVYSFKSQVGHCLGAAGIIEATAGLTAMNADLIPATINFTEPRPGCSLDCVSNTPRETRYDLFLSCNYAFGGNNAGVVVGKAGRVEKGTAPGHRTVITGTGMLTAFGVGSEAAATALREGRRGLAPVSERIPDGTAAALAGLVPELDPREVDRRLDLRSMNPISRYATVAARVALADANLRVGPRDGLDTGVVNGVYVGPSEEVYMNTVIGSAGAEADIGGFSQIVANSTAGWVSSALQLKGYASTVAQGADAGLFALVCASYAIENGAAERVLAGAADEIYHRYYINYDETDRLHFGREEAEFGINYDTNYRRVLGEGAAYVTAESLTGARVRNANVLAEIRGRGMTTDHDRFFEPCLRPDGLSDAIRTAMTEARWTAADVGLILWSPQGNRTDRKMPEALTLALGDWSHIPLLTAVFHTGLLESASGTVGLAAVLDCWKRGVSLWPAVELPGAAPAPVPEGPVNLLAVGTSDIGFNVVLAIAPPDDSEGA